MSWPLIIQGALTVGSLAYFRWKDVNKSLPTPSELLGFPATEPGTTVPIVFGRCRVDKPVIAWVGNKTANLDVYDSGLDSFQYVADVLHLIGIPFYGGVTRLQGIYIGGRRCENGGTPNNHASTVPGTGGFSVVAPFEGALSTNPEFVRVGYEFGDGEPLQDLGAGGGGNGTYDRMVAAGVPADEIPGFACIATFLARYDANGSTIPGIGFEISTYPGINYFAPGFGIGIGTIGQDANPAYVIAAVLCDAFGKLGQPTTILDWPSFQRAAEILSSENHGYSRAFDAGESAWEMIDDVLRQIDGTLYEEPTTGQLVLRLIRADYLPADALLVDPSSCEEVENYETGWGPANVNKLTVKFRSRQNQYQVDVATADNEANAVGQDGLTNEVTLDYPGCTTPELAKQLAGRELALRSRPLAKARVKVDRRFWNTRPGDVVRMTWPTYGVANKMFRVANVDRGAPQDNTITLDLIEDFFFTYRGRALPESGIGGNPVPEILEVIPDESFSFDAVPTSGVASVNNGSPFTASIETGASPDTQSNAVVTVDVSITGSSSSLTVTTLDADGWTDSGWTTTTGTAKRATFTKASGHHGATIQLQITPTGTGSVQVDTTQEPPVTDEATGSGDTLLVEIVAA